MYWVLRNNIKYCTFLIWQLDIQFKIYLLGNSNRYIVPTSISYIMRKGLKFYVPISQIVLMFLLRSCFVLCIVIDDVNKKGYIHGLLNLPNSKNTDSTYILDIYIVDWGRREGQVRVLQFLLWKTYFGWCLNIFV